MAKRHLDIKSHCPDNTYNSISSFVTRTMEYSFESLSVNELILVNSVFNDISTDKRNMMKSFKQQSIFKTYRHWYNFHFRIIKKYI